MVVIVGEGIQGMTWEVRGLAKVSKRLESEIDSNLGLRAPSRHPAISSYSAPSEISG